MPSLLGMLLASRDRRSENIRILPVIVSELEFRDVQGHIFAAHFVERADYAALEDRPEAFDGLCVDRANDILPSRMVNSRVWVILIERIVAWILIRAKQADPVRHRFADERSEGSGIHVRDYPCDHIALAANRADDWSFAGTDATCSAAAAPFIQMPVLCQAAHESFIDLDNSAEFINVLHESGSDLMAHEPSGPVRSEAHIAIYLQSAHSFLARKHEMDHAEPLPQWLICILENCASDMREAVVSGGRGAFVAQPVPLHCAVLLNLRVATPRAGYAFRPAAPGEVGATSIFVGEGLFPLGDGHLVDWLGLFGAGHIGSPSLQETI